MREFILRIKPIAPFLVFFIYFIDFACDAAALEPCKGHTSAVVVDTAQHRLWLCQEEKKFGEFKVAIGRGGIDKRKQGDKKTPLGEYSLGTPRPSNRFGIFIPVGYPTPNQEAKGFTGSAVGVHGPSRILKGLGRLSTWIDWTEGCIAVGTDKEISEISQSVKELNVDRIIIK
jgi:murein L,D-transpeptidase YafK